MKADFDLTEHLRIRWQNFCAANADTSVGVARASFNALEAAYGQPHRHYHTLVHIDHMLTEIDEAWSGYGSQPAPAALELAAWWHDFEYNIKASDNEEVSVVKMKQWGRVIGFASVTLGAAGDLIMATKKHHAAPPLLHQTIVGADLAGLGSDPARYTANSKAIRQEFAGVPDKVFREGRLHFLDGMLTRQVIYGSDHFRLKYDKQARVNMRAEMLYLLTDGSLGQDWILGKETFQPIL